MADVLKLVDQLSSLTVVECAELARLLKEKWRWQKVMLADIKIDLPAWPDDVIDQWLHYFANEPDLMTVRTCSGLPVNHRVSI